MRATDMRSFAAAVAWQPVCVSCVDAVRLLPGPQQLTAPAREGRGWKG